MATIELSSGFLTTGGTASWNGDVGYINRMISGVNNSGGPVQPMNSGILQAYIGSGPTGLLYLKIMKGAVPTNFTGLSNIFADRLSDTLVGFAGYNVDIFYSLSQNPVELSTAYKNAGASGTATWFWMASTYNNSSNSNQFIGTVGAQGSGSDMEISSTNIVSGTAYRVLRCNALTLPTSWAY
jgi:hypothetical protein